MTSDRTSQPVAIDAESRHWGSGPTARGSGRTADVGHHRYGQFTVIVNGPTDAVAQPSLTVMVILE
jgi:hypothetical protein